ALACGFQILLGLRQLSASLRQGWLQLPSIGFDLLFNAAEVMRPAAEFVFQSKPERINLFLNGDAGLRRDASARIKEEFLFQFLAPFKQPSHTRFVQTRNPSQTLFSYVSSGQHSLGEQLGDCSVPYASNVGVIDYEPVEKFVELILCASLRQACKPEIPDLGEIFVGLFLVPQIV